MQFDPRWGNYLYNKKNGAVCPSPNDTTTIAMSGCGVMAITMVINFWARNGKCGPVLPQDIADFFNNYGGRICGNGTGLSLIPQERFKSTFGMNIVPNASDAQIMTSLRKNYPCVISGKNYIGNTYAGNRASTYSGGHFVCLTGITVNNSNVEVIRVNDSGNSPIGGMKGPLAITSFLPGKTPAQSRDPSQAAIFYPVGMPSPI